jgi:hypothetical protein
MSRRLLIYVALTVTIVLIMSGCGKSSQDKNDETPAINIALDFNPKPAATGDSILLITLTKDAGDPINDATVSVRGNMNHAGMVPVLGDAENAPDDGVYSIPFEFTMGGDWYVVVSVTLADGTEITQEFDINGVSADGGMNMDSEMEMTEEADGA